MQSIDMFGARMGFVKFKGDITDEQGRVIPSIVFMRGASVGMLIVITCEEDKKQYTILTVQPRVPCGKYALEELPAGMLDSSGSFVGAAAKELQEETGLTVKEKDLIDLTEKAFKGSAYNHVYPSAGGSDEILRLFLYQVCICVVGRGCACLCYLHAFSVYCHTCVHTHPRKYAHRHARAHMYSDLRTRTHQTQTHTLSTHADENAKGKAGRTRGQVHGCARGG